MAIVRKSLDDLEPLTEERIKELTRLNELPDSEIDTSDIPELGDDFWKNARVVAPRIKQAATKKTPKA